MKYQKLGQHIMQIRGISFKPGNVITEKLDGYVPIIKSNNITEEGFVSKGLIYIKSEYIRPEQFIRNGDLVLTASSGSKKTIGKNIQFDSNYNGSFGAFCKLIRPKPTLNPKYLYHFFKTRFFRDSIEKAVQGANIANLKNEYIADLKISFPENYDDQIRIATILTQAEKLIGKRKESIKALDELLKSTFLEMFGDPVRNEKGWETVSIDNIVTCINSGTSYGGEDKKSLDNDELGVLKISAVTQGIFNPNEYKAVKKNIISKKIISLKKGMFLFSRANTKELVAACCIVDQEYPTLFLPDKLWVLTIDYDSINPNYLNFLLKNENYRNILRIKATGGHDSMLNISMQKFKTLKMSKPPLPLQNQFARIVEKVESLKTKYTQSLTELENLYGSLSQRAFKGELDLSKVPVETKKQIVELHGEVKKTSSMTGELPLSNELSASKKYSEAELIKIIQSLAGKTFSFDSLMAELEKASFEEPPKYEQLKNQIYKLLEGPNPLLSQTLVDIKNESGAVKKKIVLSVSK